MKKTVISLCGVTAFISAGCERIEMKNTDMLGKKTKAENTAQSAKTNTTPNITAPKIDTKALITDFANATPKDIVTRAHKAAGGLTWARPKSVAKAGYAVYYKDGKSLRHESHKTWRVYAEKLDQNNESKVRIYSVKDGEAVINISFDGSVTYTDQGPQPQTAADTGWSSNFGFGVIRRALGAGYRLERLPDDLIDGRAAYTVKVYDPAGGQTTFGIAQKDHKILKVGFETARGWHERIYSDFYSNKGEDWVQPGRERLYYNGEKANEVIWERYVINQDVPDCIFVLPQTVDCAQ